MFFSFLQRSSFRNFSITRDYTRFSLLIVIAIIFICFFATLSIYYSYISHTKKNIRVSARHVHIIISDIVDETRQIMNFIGKQIAKIDRNDLKTIQHILRTAKSIEYESSPILSWSGFDWINHNDEQVVVDSRILSEPVNFFNIRSYVKKCKNKPWKIHFSEPGFGIPSNKWIIPLGLGITNGNGEYVGIVSAGFEVSELNNRLANTLKDHNVKFLVLDDNHNVILKSPDFVDLDDSKLLHYRNNIVKESGFINGAKSRQFYNLTYYHKMENYPFLIITELDSEVFERELYLLLISRISELVLIGIGMVILLFFFQRKVIMPIKSLSDMAIAITNNDEVIKIPRINSRETYNLARALLKIKRFIRNSEEYKRKIEDSNRKLQAINSELYETQLKLEEYAEIAKVSDSAKEEFIHKVTSEANIALEMISTCCDNLIKQIESSEENFISKEDQLWIIKQIYRTSINIPLLTLNIDDIIPLDLLSLFKECIMIHSKNATENNIKINLNIVHIKPFFANELRFKQMILGFISRSLKYAPSKSTVNINVDIIEKDTKDFLKIYISDNGFGLSSSQINKLNSKFSSNSKPKLAALELEDSTLSKLIEMHNGEYKIESKHNKGTEIIILLPFINREKFEISRDAYQNIFHDNDNN